MTVQRLLAAGALLSAPAAHATTVEITSLIQDGIALTIQSGDFSGDVFNAAAPNLTDDALAMIHNAVAGDGIETDGFISFLAAQTSHGLAMFALIDRQFSNGAPMETDSSFIELSTIVNTMDADGWINDAVNDDWNAGSITNSFEVQYDWGNRDEGDGFAWSGLDLGDSGSFSFANYMGNGVDMGFQFLSWNGDSWTIVEGFDIPDHVNQSVDFTVVIPLPTPLGLGIAGLACVGAVTRRRPS